MSYRCVNYCLSFMLYFVSFLSTATHRQSINRPSDLYFENISIAQGLSQQSVLAMLKDRDGRLWFATQDGLNRYDGYQFTVFKHDSKNKYSISDNYIWALLEDEAGIIWIGTRNGGLNRFDPRTEKFTSYRYSADNINSLGSDQVTALLLDRDNQLWVGTANGGLNLMDRNLGTFIRYQHDPDDNSSIGGNAIKAIAQDEAGKLWLGLSHAPLLHFPAAGLNQFDPVTGKAIRYRRDKQKADTLSGDNVTSIHIAANGIIWLGTYSNGMNRLDPETGIFKRYWRKDSELLGKNPRRVLKIVEDEKNTLWIGASYSGLYEFNMDDESFYLHKSQQDNPNSLRGISIYSLLLEQDLLWVGSWRQGINKTDLNSRRFSVVKKNTNAQVSLVEGRISSIVGDEQYIWMGNDDGGLVRLSRDTHALKIYPPNTLFVDNQVNYLRRLFMPDDSQLWLSHPKVGLFRFSEKGAVEEAFHNVEGDPASLSSNFITAFAKGPDGSFWLGTVNKGINRLNPITGQVVRYQNQPMDPDSLAYDTISVNGLLFDKKGGLWVATAGGGLDYLPANSEQFQHMPLIGENSLSHKTISTITLAAEGGLWVGTQGGGINRLEYQNGEVKIQQYNSFDGLNSDAIGGIYEADNGQVWLSTAKGISRFDPDTKSFRNYTPNEGILSEYSIGSHFRDKEGNLFFGGSKGLSYFDPKAIQDSIVAPKLILTDFLIANKTVSIAQSPMQSPLQQSIQYTREIILDHTQPVFGFEFAALDYRNQSNHQYYYKMEGFDEDWTKTGASKRHATYTNLNAGDYVFQVKALNSDGVWSKNNPEVKITILPPPWKSGWAYFLYFCLLASLISSFMWQRYKKVEAIKSRNKQLSLTSKLFENTSEGVWLLDKNYEYIAVNVGFCEISGCSEQEVLGRRIHIAAVKGQEKNKIEQILNRVANRGRWAGEIWDRRKNGEVYPLEIVIDKIEPVDGETQYQYVGVFSDITYRKQSEQELERLSLYDSLTGLANRANFESQVKTAIMHNKQQEFILFYIDIDHFKKINDSIGHSIGDQLLRVIARRMLAFAQRKMSVARLGGDEMAILVPPKSIDYHTSIFAANLAKQLLIIIEEVIELDDYSLHVSASLGIATYPQDGKNYEELLRSADTAMYSAKSEGRNLYKFYTQEMNLKAKERLELENLLNEAVENEAIVAYFQPKVSLQTGELVGAEVLARWHSDSLGWVSPEIFISVAEETGQILKIGEQLLKQACRAILPCIQQNIFKGRLAVNLSALQFNQKSIVNDIDNILHDLGFPAEKLELEITESIVMGNVDHAIKLMQQFSQRQISLAIDDFGTGYSSLNYLKQFKVNTLKIDRSFVIDVANQSRDKKIVSAIIQLAHSIDLKVVAEGIETLEQVNLLRELKCEEMQGFYYSKPLAITDFLYFLKSGKRLFFDSESHITSKTIKKA